MFIIVYDYDSGKVRINVSAIVSYYVRVGNGVCYPEITTKIVVMDGKYFIVKETPEEIDRMIEEAREQYLTNVDNILGISYGNYGRK